MAQKDSLDGIEGDAEGRTPPEHPRTEGRPAGDQSQPAVSAGETSSLAPTEIAADEEPPGEPMDMPVQVDAGVETATEELPPREVVEIEETVLPGDAGAELDHPILELNREDHSAAPAPREARASSQDIQPDEEWSHTSAPEPVHAPAELAQADVLGANVSGLPYAEASGVSSFSAELPPASVEAFPHAPEARVATTSESQATEPKPADAQIQEDSHAPPIPVPDLERRKATALQYLKTGARYAAIGIGGYLALVVFLIFAYRIINPPGSTLMLFRLLGGTAIERTWVPLERISPNLVRAVIVAEDGRFCEHWGIDVEAIREAIRRSGNGTPRGASTISMQVTKNLFLWPSKSYVRKIIELPLTMLIELVWPKRRILEIYLNVAEWGPGVFGAEAAARHHFRRPSSRLSEREAALLAASLPNPVRRDAGDPGPRTSSKARVIQARMHISGPVAACVTGAGKGG